ncbi:MAG: hypothetical protein ACEPOZ_20030 [Marinifilaceae bacterium]
MNNFEITAELKGHFLSLYQMALADDDFCTSEWKMLYKFAEERNIPKEDLDNILLSPNQNVALPSTVEKRVEYLYDLAQIIWADNVVTDDELNTLKKYCRKFEFLDENVDELAQYLIDSVKNGKTKKAILNEINQQV